MSFASKFMERTPDLIENAWDSFVLQLSAEALA